MLHIKTQIHSFTIILAALLIIGLGSCASERQFKYFTQIQEDSVTSIKVVPKETAIQIGDVLQIMVADQDEMVVRKINGVSASSGAAAAPTPGYMVNDSGKINFPLIGAIKVTGMFKNALEDTIRVRLITMKFLLDPIVTVRISSFKVTVLGEVMRPGVIPVPNEKITLVDAISQSGDITIYGRRDNILIIRIKDGKRIYKRIDLTKNEVFDSEYYYLENQDIIYVEPTKKKAASLDRSSQVYSMVLSTLSILVLLYTQIAN